MNQSLLTLFILSSCLLLACQQDKRQNRHLDYRHFHDGYPLTRKDTTISDNYHGTVVADPYRWLEADTTESVAEWVAAQNDVTYGYLDRIPYRDAIEKRLRDFWDYERYQAPFKKGNFYYYFKNDGLQNQSILYQTKDLDSEGTVVLDPNTFSPDGTVSLDEYALSKDGAFLAYQIAQGGSDWKTILVKDMRTGSVLADTLHWVKFSEIAWSGDGFFYSRYPEPESGNLLTAPNEFHQVYFHKVGTPQSADELVFADRLHPQLNMYAKTSSDERFLVLQLTQSTSGNALYFMDLSKDETAFTPIVEDFDADFVFVDSQDGELLIHTNYRAPNWKLIKINPKNPAPPFWEELIPMQEDVLQEVVVAGANRIIGKYIHNVSSTLKVFNGQGTPAGNIALSGIGTVRDIQANGDSGRLFFEFESFTQPLTVYEANLDNLETEIYKAPELDFDAEEYHTEQVWYASKDGTEIPMFIIHKKGVKRDSSNPTLLYGYGGFDISIMPSFNVDRLSMFPIILENGGVCAVANIRGGGEFGADWHWAGTKEKKQNVFDDFIAAAEFLIREKYTRPAKLAIYGRSNGGLLVGACMTQRPDLYGVALPAVGVMDMLRYHKFTIGWAWATDYGRSDAPEAFNYLKAYSPLHNIKSRDYPATLITTADHDDRVVPAHSFKFAATLQEHQTGDAPVLIRIETSAGHGAGKPTAKKIEEGADLIAFTFWNMQEDVIYDYKLLR